MGWLGKVIGGTIGFALGGPLGAVAGAVFGHAFDRGNQLDDGREQVLLSAGETTQFTFFVAAFSMLAKIAKADGRISQDEVASIEHFMRHDLNLSPESRQAAINIFHAAVDSPETFDNFAAQFYGQFRSHPHILEFMIDILIRVALADGHLSPNEDELIRTAVRLFHLSPEQYEKIKSQYSPSFDKYYAVLGCNPNDSDEQIKRQYRRMVQDFHPDKIASKGLPEEFNQFAHEKFREIQEAYEMIKKERGLT
ncbi:MAG: co-chaperone DjlA [Desulfobacterales bacterium]|nr:MAG: co-chaperone DjlA [Desulfobacterales bacterium]